MNTVAPGALPDQRDVRQGAAGSTCGGFRTSLGAPGVAHSCAAAHVFCFGQALAYMRPRQVFIE